MTSSAAPPSSLRLSGVSSPNTEETGPLTLASWLWAAVRLAAVALLLFGAYSSFRGGIRFWERETQDGFVHSRVDRQIYDTASYHILERRLKEDPSDGLAQYLMATGLIGLEMARAEKGEAVKLENLDQAVKRLEIALATIQFPTKAYLKLGLAHQFGARLAREAGDTAAAPVFARRATEYLLRMSRLEQVRDDSAPSFWISIAQTADFAGRPDSALYAALQARSLPGRPLPPEESAALFARIQNASLALGNLPAAANALFRRWRAAPEDETVWVSFAGLSRMKETREASVYCLDRLIERFPQNAELRNLHRLVLEDLAKQAASEEAPAP